MGNPTLDDIANRFTYHEPPDEKTKSRYYNLRLNGKNLAVMIADYCPDGREKALAILGPAVDDENGYAVEEVADQAPWNGLR